MTTTSDNFDQAIDDYDKTAKTSSKKNIAKMIGFGAAAAGGLLACSQAEADIVSSGPINVNHPDGIGYAWDIDSDGNVDFALQNEGATTAAGRGADIFAQGTKGGFAVVGGPNGSNYPGAFKFSASAGSVSFGAGFATNAGANNQTGWMGWGPSTDVWGAFANPGEAQTGFVGIQFNGLSIGGATAATMNAYVHISYTFFDNDNSGAGSATAGDTQDLTLLDIAYNNDPTSTFAGRIGGTNFTGTAGAIHYGAFEAVPEPTGMGLMALLAMGATGVRRRRKQAS